jgi:hypothetical protein
MRDHLAAKDHKTAAEMAKHADTLWAQGRVTQASPPPSMPSLSASPPAATTLPVEVTTATVRPAGQPTEAADYASRHQDHQAANALPHFVTTTASSGRRLTSVRHTSWWTQAPLLVSCITTHQRFFGRPSNWPQWPHHPLAEKSLKNTLVQSSHIPVLIHLGHRLKTDLGSGFSFCKQPLG